MTNERWLGLVKVGAAAALVFSLGCGGEGGGSKPKDGGTTPDLAMGNDARTDADAASAPADATVDMLPAQDATTPVRLQISETSLKLVEGSPTAYRGTFFVSLTRPWSTPILVTVLSTNPNAATVMPQTIEFPANSTDSFMVTVDALEDDDTADASSTIVLSSIETGSATVAVAVDDTDVQALLALPPRLSMTEGRSEPLTVRLAYRPASAVVVTVTSSNTAKLTAGTPSLTFTAGNYNIPQTVVLTAVQDDDAAMDNVNVNLTPTGSIPAMPVPVEITDDDAINLDVTPPNLALMERATTPGTVSVSLTRPPAANVTVMVTSSNPAKATVSPATLTFTPANSATPQTVQVTPVSDDDGRDETVTLTFVAAGITPTPPSRTVAVSIDDPDSQTLQVTPAMLSLAEGATATFEVKLTLNPGAPVTVTAFSQNSAKLQVSPPVLSFNAMNFASPQMVTVKALEDDDLANDQVSITLTGSSADNVNVPVAITDDDKQVIQIIAASPGETLQMQETQSNGPPSTSQVGVRLAFRPTAPVTVLLTSGDSGRLGLSRSSLVFSPSDYASAQFVTLTAPHDDDMVDNTVELSATSTGLPLAKLAVEIRDMDTLNFNVSAASPSPTLLEGQATTEGSATFTVKLTVVPENPITPSITVTTGAGKATVNSGGCTLAGPSVLTTGCTVTVTAVQDDDARDDAVTVTVADPAGALTPRTVNFTIDDQDTQALLVVAANPVVVSEAPGVENAKTFTVRLQADPVTPTTINLAASLPGQVTLSESSIVLTTTGGARPWNAPQTITVTGLDDPDLLEQNLSVRVSATSLGVPDVFVNVRKTDDDVQALVLTQCGATDAEPANPIVLTEGPSSSTTASALICVRLKYQPDVTNTVTLTASQTPLPLGQTGPNFSLSTTTLTFDGSSGGATSYDTPRPVLVRALEESETGADNLDSEGATWDGRITISVTPFATPRVLKVNIADNDAQAILIGGETSPPAPATADPTVSLVEKKQTMTTPSASAFLRLFKIPLKLQTNDTVSSETITVTPVIPGGTSVKVSVTGTCSGAGEALTFTTATFGMAQAISVKACPDDDTRDETVQLKVHSDRPGTPDRFITVMIDDQDEAYDLTVAVTGSGGSVSAPADVNNNGIMSCSAGTGDCAGKFEPQSMVTLTETHDNALWRFVGWGGDCLTSPRSTSPTMAVTMDSSHACTATYNPRLSIAVAGTGMGTVTGSGVNCATGNTGTCATGNLALGDSATLTATPASGSMFVGWTGTGCGASVSMTEPRSCTATFEPMVIP